MAKAKKDKDKMPISWYLGSFGLAFLTVGEYCGLSVLNTDNSSGWVGIFTAVFVALSLALIATAMYAKRQDEHSDIWRIVGYLCIAVYIGVAVFYSKPFCKFVYVSRIIGEKTSLQSMATQDINAIAAVYDTCESKRNQALLEAKQRLQTYSNSIFFNKTDAFYCWVNDSICGGQGVSETKIQKWFDKCNKKIEKDSSLTDDLVEKINGWDYADLSYIASKLKGTIDGLKSCMETKIGKNPKIPKIEQQPYRHESDCHFSLNYPAKSNFAAALSNNSYSVLGLIIYVVLHLMVLICWAVAKGTNVLDISDQTEYMQTLGQEIKRTDFFQIIQIN